MEWFRWFHGAVSDDKWPLIARRSGQSVAVVVAIWAALLECASQAEVRGSIEDFDPESMDAMLGVENGTCQAVLNALSHGAHARIENNYIVNWPKRQPQRERYGEGEKSTERVRKHRERQKELQAMSLSNDSNNCETPACSPETAMKRQKQPREEQSREEESVYNNSISSKKSNITCARAKAGAENAICETKSDANLAEAELFKGIACGFEFLGTNAPGIEFKELREFYNLHGRGEAPLAGFAEYKQLRACGWPGQEAIYNAIQAHKTSDRQWNEGFAPGLAKFLREGWWHKKPSTKKTMGALSAQVKPKAEEIIMRNAEVSRKILEAGNGKSS